MQPALNCLDDLTTAAGSSLAGAGWAEGPLAVRRAVTHAVGGVAGGHPSLVLVFPDAGLPSGDVMAQAALAARGCRVAGMTSDGLVTGDGVGGRGCSALAFRPQVTVGVGVAGEAAGDMHAAGRAAAQRPLAGPAP